MMILYVLIAVETLLLRWPQCVTLFAQCDFRNVFFDFKSNRSYMVMSQSDPTGYIMCNGYTTIRIQYVCDILWALGNWHIRVWETNFRPQSTPPICFKYFFFFRVAIHSDVSIFRYIQVAFLFNPLIFLMICSFYIAKPERRVTKKDRKIWRRTKRSNWNQKSFSRFIENIVEFIAL